MDRLEELVKQFRNADIKFQENNCFLYGLFELARVYGAINAQEKTINTIIEWITNEQMSLYMQDIGNQTIRFQKESFIKELKKQFEV